VRFSEGLISMVSEEARVWVISAQGDFEQLAYQSRQSVHHRIKPSLKRTAADEKKEYTGERLTLNFQDIDVRSVLQLLADTSGQNIVVSDSVTGNLTLRLQNVPWDQALDIVLRTKGLDKRRPGQRHHHRPTEELASREKAELAAHKEVQRALAHAHGIHAGQTMPRVVDLAKLIKTNNAKDSMLSPRAHCPSTSAPTPCWFRTRRTNWPTSGAWCKPSTYPSSRC